MQAKNFIDEKLLAKNRVKQHVVYKWGGAHRVPLHLRYELYK